MMSLILNHRVEDRIANSILNITYSITIGLFFKRLFFTNIKPAIGGNESEIGIAFLLSPENWLAITLIILYFIIDWFSTNITIIEKGANHILLFLSVIFIFYYGFICSQSIFPSEVLFLHFGMYNFIVCWHDFFIPLNTLSMDGKHRLGYNIQKLLIFIVRFVISGWLAISAFVHIKEVKPMNGSTKNDMYILLVILVVAKLVRYFYYVYLNEKKLINHGD